MRHERNQGHSAPNLPTAQPHVRSRVGVLLAALLLPIVLCLQTGCGTSASAASQPLHVGLVTSLAGLGDGGLNDLTVAGLQRAESSLDAVGTVTQPHQLSQIAPAMRHDIARGDNVIIGVGNQMERPAGQVAQANPTVTFLLVDAMPRASTAVYSTLQLPNVATMYFNDQQAGALAGAFAALLLPQSHSATGNSASSAIAILSPASQPTAARFVTGFTWGAKYIEKRSSGIVGTPVNTISVSPTSAPASPHAATSACRPDVASAAANGAHVLLGLTAACQTAAIQAGAAHHLSCIGVYANVNTRGACVAGSVVEHIGQATYAMLASIAHRTFRSGMHAYDLKNGGIALVLVPAKLRSASQSRLRAFEQQLTTLQLVPPQYPAN